VRLPEVLQHKYVKRFLFARFISNFGNGMGPIALSFGILHLKNGSANILGLVVASTTISMLVISPFGGVIADKFGRVRVAGLTDMWGAVGLFFQVAFFATGHVPIWVMLIANINFGLMWGIFWPSMLGVIPALFPEESLQKANGLVNFFQNAAMIMGTAVGGIIVSVWGSTWALGIDAATFLFSGAVVFSFRKVSVVTEESTSSMFADLIHGWKVFISYRWIVAGVVGFSAIMMSWSAGEAVLGPLISLKYFNGARSWAFVLTCESIGFVIGSLVAMRLKVKYPLRFLLIASISIPIYLFAMAKPQPLIVIGLCALLWGITLDLWSSLWSTAMQREIPREALSRVSSFDAMGTMLLRPVGLAMAGPLSVAIGLTRSMELLAAISTLCLIGMALVPEMRNMQMQVHPDNN
jgi:MFS family permease